MKKFALYTAVAIVSFLIFMVIFAPASSLWLLVRDRAMKAAPSLQVLTVSGTVWSGDANLRFREFPPVDLNWHLSPDGLASQQANVKTDLVADGLQISLNTSATTTRVQSQGAGTIDSRYINTVSSRYGMTFPDRLELANLSVTTDLAWVTAITGHLSWPGGRVLMQTDGLTQSLELPPLTGDLSLVDDNVQLDVLDGANPVMRIVLKRNGWAAVDIKARLPKIAGLPIPAGIRDDASIAVLEEKIL